MALDFFAGCIGGCAGVIVGHPLDTVKIHLQTQNARNPQFTGTMDCLRKVVAKEGVKGMYKGMSSPLMGVAAINAVVFGVYGNAQRNFSNPDSLTSHFTAGAAAGLFQSFLCSPMELAKSRMQVSTNSTGGPVHCLRQIFLKEGVRGIFRGLGITICREVPAFSIYFVSYELMTRTNDNRPISTPSMLVAGGLAGIFSWAAVYPVDILKSRIQIDDANQYKNVIDCFKKSVSSEGYTFLYRGLTPTLLRAFPVNAATFAVVTWTIRLLNVSDHKGIRADNDRLWEKYADSVYTLKMLDTMPF